MGYTPMGVGSEDISDDVDGDEIEDEGEGRMVFSDMFDATEPGFSCCVMLAVSKAKI